MYCQIRRQAIKGLPDLCKDTPEHLPRIADVLTQLLQSGVNFIKEHSPSFMFYSPVKMCCSSRQHNSSFLLTGSWENLLQSTWGSRLLTYLYVAKLVAASTF